MRKGETHTAPNVRLPSGYTELTYIESTGTQHIDTEFMPTQNTRIEIEVSDWLNSETSTALYGTQSSSGDRYDLFVATAGAYRSYYGGKYVSFDSSVLIENKTAVIRDSESISIGNTTLTNTTATFTCSTSLFLFGHNTNGAVSKQASLKLYSCQIYDNGVLVRNFIPCINPSGEIGLYDTVNKKFYDNKGTGVFKHNLSFADCTWAEIIEACQTNTVPSAWEVGDSKSMIIDGVEHVIDIIGKNHDDYADGSGKAPLTFQLHYLWHFKLPMNEEKTNDLGWDGSDMRMIRMPKLLATMPSEVQSAIKEVNKLTSAGENSSTIKTSVDKLFLLSEIEVAGTTAYSFSGEGSQYAYYAAGNDVTKQLNGSNNTWWLRSPLTNSAVYFVTMEVGELDYSPANTSHGVSFAFCF